MGLGKIIVELQGLEGILFRARKNFTRRDILDIGQFGVIVGKPVICECITRVLLDSLIKVFSALPQAVPRALVPVVAPFKIKLIGFWVFRAMAWRSRGQGSCSLA